MNRLIQPKNDIMLDSAKYVDQIISPLKELSITYLSYVRIYNDNSRFDINNLPDFSKTYYYDSDMYRTYALEMNPWMFKDGFIYASHTFDCNKAIKILANDFNRKHLFVLVEKHPDYYDLWHFALSSDYTQHMYDTYLNNMDILRKFTYYFKDKAHLLIKQFEKNRLIIVPLSNEELLQQKASFNTQNTDVVKNLSTTFDPGKYHLGAKYHNAILSKREVECIEWCAKGKTSYEIGIILGITKRTVDAHLENSKRKLQCFKISQLISQLSDLGIISVVHY